jgi:hypothetical protein
LREARAAPVVMEPEKHLYGRNLGGQDSAFKVRFYRCSIVLAFRWLIEVVWKTSILLIFHRGIRQTGVAAELGRTGSWIR